ncbi:MAG: PBP1A family penicillin-binding protein [Candidatus Latescibacteria bacterium]|nr:PBP1A family penicillin-binding protein [Candidatus Latescibacterota bacterium]
MQKRVQKKNSGPLRGTFYTFLVYLLISELVIIGAAFIIIRNVSATIPDFEQLERIVEDQPLSTVLFSSDGEQLRTFQQEKRFWVNYRDIPQSMIDAVLAAEDQRFFKHYGVSLIDIFRAMVVNLKATEFKPTRTFPYFLKFKIEQGGSTITQQLAKKLYFEDRRLLNRKLKDAVTAIQIERTYSKQEIMEMYLNKMEFANNTFGIQAAAQLYFGKNAMDLTVPEAALLAGMLQNSSIYNPRSQLAFRRKAALKRRNLVLMMMARTGKIPWWKAREEIAIPIVLAERSESDWGKAPYFVDFVRRNLEKRYGREFVYTSGSKVYTTLDYRLQRIAEEALGKQLDRMQKTYDYSLHYVRPPGLTDEEAFQDSLDKTVVQGALVAIDVGTGKILAMVGGRDFSSESQFNRATMATRGAGSSFKPFVYTAALDNGWRCSDTIYDGNFSVRLHDGTYWEPSNFEDDHLGVLSLRDGFKLSRNVIAAKLVNDYDNRGIGPKLVKLYARKMGVTTYIPVVPSVSIGTAEVKLVEMVSAYTVFPNHGIKTEYFGVEQIEDKNGTVVFQKNEGDRTEVLRPEVASLMITMMKSVAVEGTGRIMIPASGMDRPCAGKTGTGQENKDAWFIGYTPFIACGVWIGYDSEETTLGKPFNTGATAAIPVWGEFMKKSSDLLQLPKDDFTMQGDITTVPLCRSSYLRATQYCPRDSIYTEFYISGTEIEKFCDKHGPASRDKSQRLRSGRRNQPRVR